MGELRFMGVSDCVEFPFDSLLFAELFELHPADRINHVSELATKNAIPILTIVTQFMLIERLLRESQWSTRKSPRSGRQD